MLDTVPHPDLAKNFIKASGAKGDDKAGLTEEPPRLQWRLRDNRSDRHGRQSRYCRHQDAFWQIDVPTINGEVKFAKDGPLGKESGQYMAAGTLIEIYSASRSPTTFGHLPSVYSSGLLRPVCAARGEDWAQKTLPQLQRHLENREYARKDALIPGLVDHDR
jgi:hypothetical protein